MFRKIRNFIQYIMFAIAFTQAARGWYYLVKDWILAIREARARRTK